MFWSCPKLTQFWESIFDALTTVLHCSLTPLPPIAIFGVVPAGVHLNATQANLVAYSTLLARRLILFKWKEASPPAFAHWVQEVLQSLRVEKIRYTMRGSTSKFYLTWRPFLDFIDGLDARLLTIRDEHTI